uniref:Uncharacterized protein n=1 Tax=Cucumis melo TaxID=3656 RepID=A0A9I9EHY8_CUCME
MGIVKIDQMTSKKRRWSSRGLKFFQSTGSSDTIKQRWRQKICIKPYYSLIENTHLDFSITVIT